MAVRLTCPPGESDTGAYKLTWKGPPGATFRLLEGGKVLYQGRDSASTVSGRPAGDYRYRVGVVAPGRVESWSAPCLVKVRPPSMALAFTLFGLGLVVFVATTVLVVRGHRAHRRSEGDQ